MHSDVNALGVVIRAMRTILFSLSLAKLLAAHRIQFCEFHVDVMPFNPFRGRAEKVRAEAEF